MMIEFFLTDRDPDPRHGDSGVSASAISKILPVNGLVVRSRSFSLGHFFFSFANFRTLRISSQRTAKKPTSHSTVNPEHREILLLNNTKSTCIMFRNDIQFHSVGFLSTRDTVKVVCPARPCRSFVDISVT